MAKGKQNGSGDLDIMIDLETLGTGPNAPVISIGCQVFDVETLELKGTFYGACQVADQLDTKIRHMTADTFKWWMSQDGAAKIVFKEKSDPTVNVLVALRNWIMGLAGSSANQTKKINVWGNGSSFDITIMETLFADYKVICPWMYYKVMDLRTFKRFVRDGEKVEVAGVKHNALADATAQAEYVIEGLKQQKADKEELEELRKVVQELAEADND